MTHSAQHKITPARISETRAHRAWLRFALLAVAGLLAGVCGFRQPLRVTDSRDLVISGDLESSSGPVTAQTHFCADSAYTAVEVADGQELGAPVVLEAEPSLVISGCMPQARARVRRGGPGRITLRVESTDAAGGGAAAQGGVEVEVPLTGHLGWWRRTVDLAALDGAAGRLTVRVELPPGARLFLKDLDVVSTRALEPAPVAARPATSKILLISIDTLREDAVGTFGGPHSTPALDRLAAEAQVFQPHYAAAGWTAPSHAGMLTGQPPRIHGVERPCCHLHPGVPTLAERFRDAGLRTAALVYDGHWLSPELGFGRGFDTYRVEAWRIERSVREVERWMTEHRSEPFFFFFHTYEPHSDRVRLPYESPGTTQRTVERRFGVPRYGCRDGSCASRLLTRIHTGEIPPLPGEAEILHFLYDRGAAETDRRLGELFDHLRRLGLWDEMLVVVTSDHGESFLEHGQLLHGTPWEEVLRVPLIIKWPQGLHAGERQRRATSALDLAPTLLLAAGLEARGLPGRSLPAEGPPRPIFSGYNFRAVIAGGLKAVFHHEGGEDLLYDLETDPDGWVDVGDQRPEDLERLRGLLETREQAEQRLLDALAAAGGGASQQPAPALSPEREEQLRALGYLR